MYEKFILRNKKMLLTGYDWELKYPIAVICLIHGIGEYAERYDKIAEIFNRDNIAVVSMDLRGHGLTEGIRGHAAPRNSVLEDIDCLIRFIEDKYVNTPIFIYGHSMGGNIGLDYRRIGSKKAAIKGYIITGPWLVLIKKIPKILELFVTVASYLKPEATMDTGLDASKIAHVENEVKDYIRNPLIHKKISLQTAVDCMKASKLILSSEPNSTKDLLIMHGTHDRICDIEGSRKLKKLEGDNATLIEWDGLYHEIHNEKEREKVIKAEIDWIKSILII
jgi:alpha-beta hydrolase superfamily lysophospholipase